MDIPGQLKTSLFIDSIYFLCYTALASKLKEKANALYRQKSFAKANEVYRLIIERYANNVPAQLIRTTRCNRAACFIELGESKILTPGTNWK